MPYDLILADPPWRYSFSRSTSRKIENHYGTMTLDDICSLPVPGVCADDSVLYLWATAPKLPEALSVMDAWGFKYVTNAIWDKRRIGMGYYFRGRHELILVGRRGTPRVPAPAARAPSVIEEPRGAHSSKPSVVYEILERAYPQANKVELFARARRPGWDAWGDAVDSDIELEGSPENGSTNQGVGCSRTYGPNGAPAAVIAGEAPFVMEGTHGHRGRRRDNGHEPFPAEISSVTNFRMRRARRSTPRQSIFRGSSASTSARCSPCAGRRSWTGR